MRLNPSEFFEIGRTRRAVGVAVAAAFLACAPAVLAASSTSAPKSVVTPAEAQAALNSYSEQNSAADRTLSIAAQHADEQGTARMLDDSWFEFEAAAGFKTLDGTAFYPFTFEPLEDSVAAQTTYPASFAIATRTNYAKRTPAAIRGCPNAVSMLVFRRRRVSTPWKVVLEPTVDFADLPKFATATDGYAPTLDLATLAVSPTVLPSQLAASLRAYEATGAIGPYLSAADFVAGSRCWSLPSFHALAKTYATGGAQVSFNVGRHRPSDTQAFALTSGGALVITSINFRWNVRARSPHTIKVTPVRGDPISHQVPAGSYRQLTEQGICQIALIDPRRTAHSSATASIVGADCGELPGTGR